MEEKDKALTLATFTNETTLLANTLLAKNLDYGNSIFETGVFGVLCRIFDKMKRIQNLIVTGEHAVENEPLEDTFQDLAGYSTLGLLIMQKHPTFYNEDGSVKKSTNWIDSKWVSELKEILGVDAEIEQAILRGFSKGYEEGHSDGYMNE